MEKIATITNENGLVITISFDGRKLFTEAFGEPTEEIGPEFENEQAAADYVQDSYNSGWNLIWTAVSE